MSTRRHHRAGAALARVVLPIAGTSLVLVGIMFSGDLQERMTVSAVTRRIQDIALAGSDPSTERTANNLGPWRLAARKIEPITGEFLDLRIETSELILVARSGRLRIDAAADTFTFDLQGVVFTRVPGDDEPDAGYVHELESYVLGPAPFGINIVPDSGRDVELPPVAPAGDSPRRELVEVDDYAAHPE